MPGVQCNERGTLVASGPADEEVVSQGASRRPGLTEDLLLLPNQQEDLHMKLNTLPQHKYLQGLNCLIIKCYYYV